MGRDLFNKLSVRDFRCKPPKSVITRTSIPGTGATRLAVGRIVTDAIAVDVAGAEGIGTGLTLAEAGVGREGLVVLTDSQLTGHELVQVAGDSASSEESGCGEIEGMHRGFLL